MIAPEQILPPANWQDFESLCKKLWGDLWHTDSIKKNGKSGDTQNGVDVYAKVAGKYFGIQCKLKEQLTEKQLNKSEIDAEIEKAKSFKPSLTKLIFATTASKNADIEEYIRIRDDENTRKGLFEIELFSWEDIVDLLMESKSAYDWYVRNIYFDKGYKAQLSINGKLDLCLHPHYIRKLATLYYIMPPVSCHDWHKYELATNYLNDCLSKHNLFHLSFALCNIGDTMFENYRLEVRCKDAKNIFSYTNESVLPSGLRLQSAFTERLCIEQSMEQTIIQFAPQMQKPLVQSDYVSFDVYLTPNVDAQDIELKWELWAKDYHTEGEIKINIDPIISELPQIDPNCYTKEKVPDGGEIVEDIRPYTMDIVRIAKNVESEEQYK